MSALWCNKENFYHSYGSFLRNGYPTDCATREDKNVESEYKITLYIYKCRQRVKEGKEKKIE